MWMRKPTNTAEIEFGPTDTPPKLGCPNCESKLAWGEGTRVYETLDDHVSCNDHIPERPYLVCPNSACELHQKAFWDDGGDFYGKTAEARTWYLNNRIDSQDVKTFRRKGVEALNSVDREVVLGFVYYRRNWWLRLLSRLRNQQSNWACELRRLHSPYTWDAKTSLKDRILYSFGVFMMDPTGKKFKRLNLSKWAKVRPDSESDLKYTHHPFPWIRNKAKKRIQDALEEKNK